MTDKKPAPETLPALIARLLDEHSTGPDYDGRCKHSADLRRLSRAVREMRRVLDQIIYDELAAATGIRKVLVRLDEGE